MDTVSATVRQILDDIRDNGISKALEYTARFDGIELSPDAVIWDITTLPPAAIDRLQKDAMDFAITQIRAFHEATKPHDIQVEQAPGLILTERMVPLERVGIYVPNGQYPLISSLFMTAIPAQVAGVQDIVVAIAPKAQDPDPVWIYALQALGIRTVVRLGGAQAIAALGYGLAGLLDPVDLIAGPGNQYVAEAKQELFRRKVTGIDVIAGPSEVLIIASPGAPPEVVAMDLLAQAEHARDAHAYMVSWDAPLMAEVQRVVTTATMHRNAPLGPIDWITVSSPWEAVAFANRTAPEHLGLIGKEAEALAPQIRTAGALFVGWLAGQALGDYVAGPSHVLPTAGTGRFLPGLSTRTFTRRMSIIEAQETMPDAYLSYGQVLAAMEGLQFHEQSLQTRHALRSQSKDVPL
ncbi:MAG: histidinol dehydrogenase [Sulfobacillus thermosulfidooxidans]|nr:MAG: histidinol dehydrogenase [Sulfobacillus thermosulfidooxidans]